MYHLVGLPPGGDGVNNFKIVFKKNLFKQNWSGFLWLGESEFEKKKLKQIIKIDKANSF